MPNVNITDSNHKRARQLSADKECRLGAAINTLLDAALRHTMMRDLVKPGKRKGAK